MFTHMGAPNDVSYNEALEDFQVSFNNKYPGIIYPDSLEKAIRVKAGDWIGMIGVRGAAASPHTHLEVFEYFPDDPGSEVKTWSQINGKWQWINIDYGKWKRIDPTTLWHEGEDYVIWIDQKKHILDIARKSGMEFTQDEIEKCFRRWTYTDNNIYPDD